MRRHPGAADDPRMSAKRIGAATLLVVGTLFWTGAVLGVWAQRQALSTDNWVTTSSELLENRQIRDALGVAIVTRLYDSDAVAARLRETLPPRLDRLAAPAAAGLKELAIRNAPRILGTTAALTAWEAANRRAHQAFVAIADGKVAAGGEVNLDVAALLKQVAAGTGLPAGAADKLPPQIANVQVFKSDELATLQDAVALFRDAVWVFIVLGVAAFAGAIFLGRDRRRSVVAVGACLIIAGVAVLAIRRVGGVAVTDALADAPNAHAVAPEIWSIATSLLVDAAQGSMLFGLFLLSGAWLAGAGRLAIGVRRVSAPMFREHPGVVHGGLALAILLLVLWSPVPWTSSVLPLLIFTVGAFAWLEWLRRRTLEEFPDVGAGELGRVLGISGWLGRRRGTTDDTVPSA
jgi:hypothetical protein